MNQGVSMTMEIPTDEIAKKTLVEGCLSQVCPEVFASIARIMGAIEVAGEIFRYLEAAAHVGEMTVPGKLRDDAIIINPEPTKALSTKAEAVRSLPGKVRSNRARGKTDFSVRVDLAMGSTGSESSEAKSDSSPAVRPGATTVVAGMPGHAAVAPEPPAVKASSATPISTRSHAKTRS